MRLIDADSLKTVICLSVCSYTQSQLCTCGCAQILAVDNAPTIEAEPVRHGHWLRRRLRVTASCLYKCSACGHCVNTADIWAYKFCYHCGAKMDEASK